MIMKENRFEFTSPQKGFKVLSKSRSCGYLTADFTTLTMPTKEALKINHVINVAIIYDKVVALADAYVSFNRTTRRQTPKTSSYPLFVLAVEDKESPTAQYLFRIIAESALKAVLKGDVSINEAVKSTMHSVAHMYFNEFSVEYVTKEFEITEKELKDALVFFIDVYKPNATLMKNIENAVKKANES